MRSFTDRSALVLFFFISCACTRPSDAEKASPSGASTDAMQPPGPREATPIAPAVEKDAPSPQVAQLGQPAPEFTLTDLEGKKTQLSEYRGKLVVLEWFNPECPFVKAAHTKGSLQGTAKALMKEGVVYLAINSGAPGKQGHGREANLKGKADFGLTHPILLDETGAVGKAYGATNTPHLFIISAEGLLVYRGAIDNSKDGEGASPEGGTLVNYLTLAVSEIRAGKPVSVPETKAYGCSVKYGQ